MKTKDIIVGGLYAYSPSSDKTVEKYRHMESMWPVQVKVLAVGISRRVHSGGRMVSFHNSLNDDGIQIEFLSGRRVVVPPVHIRRAWAEQEQIHQGWRVAKQAQDETSEKNKAEATKAAEYFEKMGMKVEIPIHGHRLELTFVDDEARNLIEMVKDWLT